MKRLIRNETALLVEGTSDYLFFRPLVTSQYILEVSTDKSVALQALAILEASQVSGVVVIVDSDFWKLEGDPPRSPNVLATDCHDIELMIVQTPAFLKVLAELGSSNKIGTFESSRGAVRDEVIRLAAFVGSLRYLSHRDGLSLKFKELSFGAFVDQRLFSLDFKRLISEVLKHSHMTNLSSADIQVEAEKLAATKPDPWHICNGHDVSEILSIGLRRVLGSCRAIDVERDSIERSLRLAYEEAYFTTTRLYAQIRNWESANSPYRVLK